MQDRYVGDVGDFGKLGLLRHLCGATAHDGRPTLKPGVIWYRVPDENHNGDGGHISYLTRSPRNDRRFRACDETIYDALAALVDGKRRSIAALERADLLPNAVYWKEPISKPRDRWFDRASNAVDDCDLVFVDPDNGIECAGLRDTQARSNKFVFRSEIHSLAMRHKGVIVYHHIGRIGGTAEQQTEQHLRTLCDEPTLPQRPFGVLFRRGTTRAYLILPSTETDRQVLLARTESLMMKWPGHFTGPVLI